MTINAEDRIDAVVANIDEQAQGICAWHFQRPDGSTLPAFTAGAHIDLHLDNGWIRSYSLCNSQDEQHRYVVAINNDTTGRGGSRLIHERLKVGDRLTISRPRNHFALNEQARHTAFFAGGIGITPIWSMIQRLEQLGRSWELHYSTRMPDTCAFRRELTALEHARPGRVHFNFDHEPGARPTDLKALIKGLAPDTDLYCCGPAPMLQAFEAAAGECVWQPSQVHVEYFASTEQAAVHGGYDVILRHSDQRFTVAPGQTILKTLLANGIDVSHSCTEGVCGMCETRVLAGIPDHRDAVLTDQERAANQTMMICCSGSKSPEIVLDL